jgi:RimJ/RimL family protein N-acetyltransferase
MFIILETPRLILRRFTDTDADASLIYDLNNDTEVLKYLHEPILQDVANAKEILRNIILPQYAFNLGRWATLLKINDHFIGWCGLKHRPELNEMILVIVSKKLHGAKVMQQKPPPQL